MTQLVAATANPAKLTEIAAILGLELLPRPEEVGEVDESAPDLVGNARLKAEAVATYSGLAAVADDTGLEVEVLDGAPGVRSARYAGEDATDDDNIDLLLRSLDGVAHRRARFHTVAMVWSPDRELIAHGYCSGVIAAERRGTHGFGYDPVFIPDEGDGRSFAEMSTEEKNAISHRGRAFRALQQLVMEG